MSKMLDKYLEGLVKEAQDNVQERSRVDGMSAAELAEVAGIKLAVCVCPKCGSQMDKEGDIYKCGCGMMKSAAPLPSFELEVGGDYEQHKPAIERLLKKHGPHVQKLLAAGKKNEARAHLRAQFEKEFKTKKASALDDLKKALPLIDDAVDTGIRLYQQHERAEGKAKEAGYIWGPGGFYYMQPGPTTAEIAGHKPHPVGSALMGTGIGALTGASLGAAGKVPRVGKGALIGAGIGLAASPALHLLRQGAQHSAQKRLVNSYVAEAKARQAASRQMGKEASALDDLKRALPLIDDAIDVGIRLHQQHERAEKLKKADVNPITEVLADPGLQKVASLKGFSEALKTKPIQELRRMKARIGVSRPAQALKHSLEGGKQLPPRAAMNVGSANAAIENEARRRGLGGTAVRKGSHQDKELKSIRGRVKKAALEKQAKDMPSFTEQDRPKKVKEIYRALKREHPEMPAEMKARIAARQGKPGKQHQGPPYKGPLTKEKKSEVMNKESAPRSAVLKELKSLGQSALMLGTPVAAGATAGALGGDEESRLRRAIVGGTLGLIPGLVGGATGSLIGVDTVKGFRPFAGLGPGPRFNPRRQKLLAAIARRRAWLGGALGATAGGALGGLPARLMVQDIPEFEHTAEAKSDAELILEKIALVSAAELARLGKRRLPVRMGSGGTFWGKAGKTKRVGPAADFAKQVKSPEPEYARIMREFHEKGAAAKLAAVEDRMGSIELNPEDMREAAEEAALREDIGGRGRRWGIGSGVAGGVLGAGAGAGIGRLLQSRLGPWGYAAAPLLGGLGAAAGSRIGSAHGAEEALHDKLVSLLRQRQAEQAGFESGVEAAGYPFGEGR